MKESVLNGKGNRDHNFNALYTGTPSPAFPVLFTEYTNSFFSSAGRVTEILPGRFDRHPFVILADGIPVGFFVLHIGENTDPFTSDKKAILLRGFLVDQKHQGKGIGKKALQILPEFAKGIFPNKDSIILAVDFMNMNAKTLYTKSGFQDKEFRRKARSGLMEIMEYRLDMGNKDIE